MLAPVSPTTGLDLSLRHYRYAGRIALGLAFVAASIRIVGVRRSTRLVWYVADRSRPRRPHTADPEQTARTLAGRIAMVGERMPFPPRCLSRSLLLAGLLRRHGLAAELWIGVGNTQPFEAHAWVEMTGIPVNDAADVADRYRRLWHLGTRVQ